MKKKQVYFRLVSSESFNIGHWPTGTMENLDCTEISGKPNISHWFKADWFKETLKDINKFTIEDFYYRVDEEEEKGDLELEELKQYTILILLTDKKPIWDGDGKQVVFEREEVEYSHPLGTLFDLFIGE